MELLTELMKSKYGGNDRRYGIKSLPQQVHRGQIPSSPQFVQPQRSSSSGGWLKSLKEKNEQKSLKKGLLAVQKLKENKGSNLSHHEIFSTLSGFVPAQIADRLGARIFQEQEKAGVAANIKKAYDEILTIRKNTGKPVPSGDRVKILAKNGVPLQKALELNAAITARQERAKPKLYSTSWVDPVTGETRAGLKPKSELIGKGVLTKKPTKFAMERQKILNDIASGESIESLSKRKRFIAGIPIKAKKYKYDLKAVTDQIEKNTFLDEARKVGILSPESVPAIKDMLSKSDAKDTYELVKVELPAEKSWIGDVGEKDIPAVTTWKLQKKGTAPDKQSVSEWKDADVRRILKQSGLAETPENIEKFKAQN